MNRLLLILFLLPCPGLFAKTSQPAAPDRVEVRGGVVLTGRAEAIADGKLRLVTDYAGVVSIDLARINRLVLGPGRELDVPDGVTVVRAIEMRPETEEDPALIAATAVAEDSAPAPKPAAESAPRWAYQGGINLTGREGNTERFDLTITADAKLERKGDRTDIYGRYVYGKNSTRRLADEVILGARYTNFFSPKFGYFIREELERDHFEGLSVRSTTAAGLTYRIRNAKDLKIESRSGFSYRYEDYFDDGTADFPGLDFGLQVNWRFVKWSRFTGTYTFLPSLASSEDFLIEQDSGFNMPLDTSSRWELRFGVASQYNNQPDRGREKLDLRYYLRLIARWE